MFNTHDWKYAEDLDRGDLVEVKEGTPPARLTSTRFTDDEGNTRTLVDLLFTTQDGEKLELAGVSPRRIFKTWGN